jgi:hypothetical protein
MLKKVFNKIPFKNFCNYQKSKVIKTQFGYKPTPKFDDKTPTNFEEISAVAKNESEVITISSDEYYDLLDKHYQMKIPFTDNEYYLQLFQISSQIVNNADLESWNIIDRYVILNLELIEKSFIINVIEQLSKFKYYRFEFWYMIENWCVKNVKNVSNAELAISIYSFAHAEKGSNYLYTILSKEVLDRGLRSFNEREFVMIYNGFKICKIKDKLLWAFLNKAREEVYSEVNIEN